MKTLHKILASAFVVAGICSLLPACSSSLLTDEEKAAIRQDVKDVVVENKDAVKEAASAAIKQGVEKLKESTAEAGE
jgi:hypothetical protein